MVLVCLQFVVLPTVQCSASYLPANCVNWSLVLKNCGVRTLLHGFVKITSVFDKVGFTNGLGHLSTDPAHLC